MKALALVLATGALLAGGAATAQAAEPVAVQEIKTQDINTTIDAHSNVRVAPNTKAKIVYTTRTLTPTTIFCYEIGEWVTDGTTSTAVWYGNVDGFVWGGNVNTTQDPPPGLRTCRD